MADRLREIKATYDHPRKTLRGNGHSITGDIDWLIKEVERLRSKLNKFDIPLGVARHIELLESNLQLTDEAVVELMGEIEQYVSALKQISDIAFPERTAIGSDGARQIHRITKRALEIDDV